MQPNETEKSNTMGIIHVPNSPGPMVAFNTESTKSYYWMTNTNQHQMGSGKTFTMGGHHDTEMANFMDLSPTSHVSVKKLETFTARSEEVDQATFGLKSRKMMALSLALSTIFSRLNNIMNWPVR